MTNPTHDRHDPVVTFHEKPEVPTDWLAEAGRALVAAVLMGSFTLWISVLGGWSGHVDPPAATRHFIVALPLIAIGQTASVVVFATLTLIALAVMVHALLKRHSTQEEV